MSPKCKEYKKGERQAVHMHYLPFGARLNKGILMVTQLSQGFPLIFKMLYHMRKSPAFTGLFRQTGAFLSESFFYIFTFSE